MSESKVKNQKGSERYRSYPARLAAAAKEYRENPCRQTETALYDLSLRIAQAVVSRYLSVLTAAGLEMEDSINIASMAIFIATAKFDPKIGTFLGYCSATIFQELMKACRETGRISKIPEADMVFACKISRELGLPLTMEILESVGQNYDQKTYKRVEKVVLLKDLAGRYGEGPDGDTVDVFSTIASKEPTPEESVVGFYNEDAIQLAEALDQLSERERILVCMKHGLGGDGSELSFEALSKDLGRPVSTVSGGYYRGIEKLKKLMVPTE